MASEATGKFDSLKLSLFEIATGDRSTDTKIVISGVGHPRAVVVSVTFGKMFELIGGLLSACEKIDREATVRCLRGALSHVDSSSSVAVLSSAGSATMVDTDPDDPMVSQIIGYAKTIQNQGRKAGLSDPAIGALISLAMAAMATSSATTSSSTSSAAPSSSTSSAAPSDDDPIDDAGLRSADRPADRLIDLGLRDGLAKR